MKALASVVFVLATLARRQMISTSMAQMMPLNQGYSVFEISGIQDSLDGAVGTYATITPTTSAAAIAGNEAAKPRKYYLYSEQNSTLVNVYI